MDQYSFAELTEFYFLTRSDADTQFQFWISITFAVIIAAFAAGEHLTRKLRYIAATLYMLATIALVILFATAAVSALRIATVLSEADAFVLVVLPNSVWGTVIVARWSLFILGTAAALYFLLRNTKRDSSDS